MTHNERYAMAKGTLIGFFATLVTCIGFFVSEIKDREKEYPVEVLCYWKTDNNSGHPYMDADSVRNDTIYRDGNWIINKNIINLRFK